MPRLNFPRPCLYGPRYEMRHYSISTHPFFAHFALILFAAPSHSTLPLSAGNHV
ncbi:hypothetical protein CGRA01v4_10630 [Colletotrichum graminicola]|nr:hypothetical protein CGRA01v4_10630 [Colletotrichum graminicola]